MERGAWWPHDGRAVVQARSPWGGWPHWVTTETRGGDGKMGEGTGGGTTQGLLSSPELGLNVSRPVSPGLAV